MFISSIKPAVSTLTGQQPYTLLTRFRTSVLKLVIVSTAVFSISSAFAGSYTLFESGQVRPLAMSPDGSRLFALNTPDNRLEVFNIQKDG